MSLMSSAVLVILTFQVCEFVKMPSKDMTMDQVIMAAAKNHEMFDLAHVMDGEIMAMVELDLLMTLPELAKYKQGASQGRYKRKATSNDRQLWQNCRVFYDFTAGDFSARDQTVIMRAISQWENFTCLNFTRSSTQPSRIMFRNGGGCYSRLGRTGGVQPIALAPGCRSVGIVVHEIGHAIGWIHEQARPDRDEFITVDFNKIPANWRSQFAKVREALINDRDVTYDYDSIMHYSGNVFGPRTIITRDPAAQNRLGQRTGLSFRDIKLANLMYKCAEIMDCEKTPCPGEGFRLKNCKCVCPGPIGNPLVPCGDQPATTQTPTTTSTTASTTTVSPVSPPGPDCMDLIDNCQTLKANGSCTRDRARMSVFCRETCELCNEEPACMDYDDACPFFASNGYCEREGVGEFFKQECPLSCELCTAVDRCQAQLDGLSSSTRNGISAFMSAISMLVAVFCM